MWFQQYTKIYDLFEYQSSPNADKEMRGRSCKCELCEHPMWRVPKADTNPHHFTHWRARGKGNRAEEDQRQFSAQIHGRGRTVWRGGPYRVGGWYWSDNGGNLEANTESHPLVSPNLNLTSNSSNLCLYECLSVLRDIRVMTCYFVRQRKD